MFLLQNINFGRRRFGRPILIDIHTPVNTKAGAGSDLKKDSLENRPNRK
jgi:hypothetical protein